MNIKIISSSVRNGRNSHRVALYLKNFIESGKIGAVEILDLNKYNFPVFDERLRFQESPADSAVEFAGKIKEADGIIIVTPEYNGGYPASIKNAIDLLYGEWHHKPVAISTVSEGGFGGSQVLISLQFVLWKMHAWTVPATFPVPNVSEAFDEKGIPLKPESVEKRASVFISELLWCIEAGSKMKS